MNKREIENQDSKAAHDALLHIKYEREQKEALQRALSEEAERNKGLVDQKRSQEERIMHYEKDISDLKTYNARLQSSETVLKHELELLQGRNATIQAENDQMQQKLRAQEDAIASAHLLQTQTDHMLKDYDNLKQEFNFVVQKNEDLQRNLNSNAVARRKAEDNLLI